MRLGSVLAIFLCTFVPEIGLSAAARVMQTPPISSTDANESDQQAVATVQNAISALGGASNIAAVTSWTLNGTLSGLLENGTRTETITTDTAAQSQSQTKQSRRDRRHQSLFAPALIAAILLAESQERGYTFRYGGIVQFKDGPAAFVTVLSDHALAERWYFDQSSGLPKTVQLLRSTGIASAQITPGVLFFSNYQAVAGVMYPFHIRQISGARYVQEVLSLSSIMPGSAATPQGNNASLPLPNVSAVEQVIRSYTTL